MSTLEDPLGGAYYENNNLKVRRDEMNQIYQRSMSMKKFSYTFVVLAGLFFAGAFQLTHAGWSHFYGGGDDDWGVGGHQATDGGYIIVGSTKSFGAGEEDFWVLKLDSDGVVEKMYPLGTALSEKTSCSVMTPQGECFFTGDFMNSGDTMSPRPNVCLYKLNAEGDMLWWRPYHDTFTVQPRHLLQTADGGFLIVAEKLGEIYVYRTDGDGDSIWAKSFAVEHRRVGYAACNAHDGGYIIAGASWENGIDDLWLLKITDDGDTVWSKTYGGEHLDDAFCIQPTADGNYILTGRTTTMADLGTDLNLWLLKIKEIVYGEFSTCDTLWAKAYGGDNSETGEWVEETSDGGFIVGGWTKSFGEGEADFWLLKTNSEGDTTWTATYGGPDKDRCECVQLTSDGGYLLTGYTSSFGSGGTDMWVVKTDSLGSIAVAENPIAKSRTDWLLITSIGQKIALSYTDRPNGFHAQVFDATGRMVDEINAAGPSGTLTWGECCGCYGPGVYFIRDLFSNQPITRKVVLID
jgi:hypothetical protein